MIGIRKIGVDCWIAFEHGAAMQPRFAQGAAQSTKQLAGRLGRVVGSCRQSSTAPRRPRTYLFVARTRLMLSHR